MIIVILYEQPRINQGVDNPAKISTCQKSRIIHEFRGMFFEEITCVKRGRMTYISGLTFAPIIFYRTRAIIMVVESHRNEIAYKAHCRGRYG